MRKYRRRFFLPHKIDLIDRARIAEERAKELRVNITKSEEKILKLLERLNYKFIFQYPKFDEWYFLIADFYIPSLKLMIEIDGESHNNMKSKKKEYKRRIWLLRQGIKVLRIKNKATIKMTKRQLDRRIKRASVRRTRNVS